MIRIIISILLVTLLARECFSLPTNQNLDEKIYINSDTLEVDYKKNTAEYKSNVFIQKKGNFDLYCDKAKIFSAPKESQKKKASSYTNDIKHIELYDNITIVKEEKIAKGDFGVIYPKKNLIVLTGKVKLKEKTETKESYLEGHKIKYYMDKEIFEVTNNISKNNSRKGKVKIILSKSENKND
ncbi:MAG: hypothetical protein HRU36_00250 [Rickettsiales bacterium]|nr:hypothetical protein [Rickettsiales bacterium]